MWKQMFFEPTTISCHISDSLGEILCGSKWHQYPLRILQRIPVGEADSFSECEKIVPRSRWEATATTTVSTRQGVKANLKTIPLSLFNACGSRPRPARINITTNAIPRKILQNNTICISNFSFHSKTKAKWIPTFFLQ